MSNNNNTPPPWSEAPPWAMWKAQNKSGGFWWYEEKPKDIYTCWHEEIGRASLAWIGYANENWRDTLQKRPENE